MGSTKLFPPRSALLPALLAAASLTCGGDGVVLPKEGEPANVAVMAGNNQIGIVGTALPESLVVRITDPSDRPVVGAKVRFALGPSAAGGDVSPDTVTTDSNGEAPVRWVLGIGAGAQVVQVRVVGFNNVGTSLNATANAGAADTIFALSGDVQTGTAGAALAESLVVRVNDQFGNAVAGTAVTWTVSGGGSVSSTGGSTGTNGETAVQRTLGPASGPQAAAASATGLKGSPVIFTHTAGSGAPVALQIIQGNNQTAPAGFALAESLIVRLVDANGNGVADRAVAWAVTAGGGTRSPASTLTDASGFSATQWTLGTTAGNNTLLASAVGFVANFSATSTNDVPTRISIVSGNNQTGAAGQALPVDPTVVVQDVNNNPVAGVAVTFTVTGGGGAVVPTSPVATGADGRASVTSWTLGPSLGSNTLEATASGPGGPLQGSPLSFTATAIAGAATQIAIITQPPPAAASGAALSPAPVVQIRDASGNPVNQAGVNITVSLASGTGPLGGTLTRSTNASGQATFTGLSINGLVGSYSLAFNSSGLTGATSSSIALAAGAPTRLSLSTQPPGGASSGVALSPQPIVQVLDAAGNPVPQAGVNVTAALTGATGTLGGTTTIATNASGAAAFTDLTITGPSGSYSFQFTSTNPVLTPVTSGNITIGAGAPTTIAINGGDNQTATAGATLPTDPSVVVRDAGGNTVAGVTVTFAVASGGGSITGPTVVTNASGIAAVGSWTLGCTAGTNTLTATSTGLSGSPLTFTATGNVGNASQIQIQAGNNQAATVGTPVAVNPSVLVTDACGNPVSGITTTWVVTAGGGSTIGGNTTTDQNGLATMGWILGGTAGTNTLTVTRAGLTGSPVTFTATAVTGSANTIAVNAGNNQTATINTTLPIDPSVVVTDAGGNGVPGVQVTFAVASGGGSITGATQTTDANGIATVGNWTLGATAGSNTLTATAPGLVGSPVTFTATGTVGAATTIAINGGNNQTATVGTPLPVDPSVIVRDAGGNPVPGVSVTFAVTAGGGSITGGSATTNAAGIATVGSWTLGTQAGTNTMTATSGTLSGSPITFSATGMTGAATTIVINGGNNQTAAAGATLPVDPSVLVTDAGGNPVQGVSVTFAVGSGGGSITGGTQTTNASGIAAVGSWRLGNAAGTNTLTATSAGLTGSPVTFTATGTVGAATTMAINAGNNQTATAGSTLPTNPSVIVTDNGGNPVPGIAVTFAVASGGGSITGGSATTDAGGIATVGSWTLGPTVGTNTLTATSAGLSGSPRTFTATGTAGAATTIAINGGNGQTRAVNQVLLTDPSVIVTDAGGNPVQGVGVTFAVGPNSGSITGANQTTNVNGIATVGSWQLDTLAGTNTLTATSAGLNGSPVTFTATGTPAGLNAPHSTATVPNGVAGSPTTISIQARDAFGNIRTTGGGSWTVAVTGANTANPSVTDNGDGTYTATYTPVVGGTDIITIRLGGTQIGGSPYNSTVAKTASSTAITSHTPAPSVVGQGITVDVSVSGSGPTPGGSVTVSDGTDSCNITLSGGDGSCVLTPSTSGNKTLTATYAGNATYNGSVSPGVSHQVDPFGNVSASQSTVSVFPVSITASNGGSDVAVTVTARDGFGNLVSGVSVVLSASGSGNSIGQPGLTNSSGVATGTVSSTVAEAKTISAVVDGVSINDTQGITVTPAAADAASSTANVPSGGSPGNPTTITIQARDQFGNDLTVGGATVQITVSGANSAGPFNATDNGDGTYTGSYTPTASGPDQIDITLNGSPISGSPFNTTVAIGSASQIQIFAGNNQSAPIGGTLSIDPTIKVTDGFGNPVPGVPVQFTVTGGGGSIVVGSGQTGSNGQVGVAWTLGPAVGANQLSASSPGLSGSPVLFTASATPATPVVTIQAHSPDPSDAGDQVSVTYTVVSTVGSPSGNVTVSDGVDSCVGTVNAGSCSLSLTMPGIRPLVASYQGDANFNAASSATANHRVNQATSSTVITGHTPDPSVVGQGITVDVTVNGSGAGTTPGGSVLVSDGTDSCNLTLSGGSGSCLLTASTSGSKALTATYSGNAVYLGSVSPGVAHQVNPSGSVSPSQSTLGVDNLSITASNGSSAVTVTVTARDGFGNPVSGANVVLSATGAGNALTQPGLTNANGVATGTVSSTGAGGKTISATIDLVSINQTQVITVLPATAHAATTTANVPAGGSAGSPTTITIQARDQFGNNVTVGGATVEVTVSGANNAGPILATDNDDGTYSASYTPAASGPDQVDITLGGAPISGSPFNSTVAAGSAGQIMILAGNNQSAPIGSLLGTDPAVLVTDGGGNPVSGVAVQFTVTTGGGSIVSGSAQSDVNGQLAVAWTLGPTVGLNELTATAPGLSGSPVVFSATASPGTPAVAIQAHTPDPSVVGQGISVDVTVSGPGAIPTGSVTVTDQTDSCVITLLQGNGSCVLTPTTSGSKTLSATYGGDGNYFGGVSSAGATHQVDGYGPVDPSTSTATVPDGLAGNTTTMHIVTRDQFGNLVGTGGASVSVDISGANPGSAVVTDNGDGTYTAEYTPATPGSDTITVQVNAVQIPGSPFTSTVS
jgi:hypothetical protein